MINEKKISKPLGQLQLEKFCKSHNNLIINYISKLYNGIDFKIKLMTNKETHLKRNTHCGAHICVETPNSNDYFYITTSRKDYLCQNFLTINNNLLPLIKKCAFNYKILLFSCGKIHRFNQWIFDDIKENENGFVNVPLTEAEDVYTYSADDFSEPEHYVNIKWECLAPVRYSQKFDMHKKPITIVASEYRYKRTFDSKIKAYAALTGTKVENGKVVGKPVANAAYLKGYKQFLRDIRDNKLYLLSDNGTSFQVTVVTSIVDTEQLAADVSTSLLVEREQTTNRDVDTSVTENCNIEKDGGQRRLDKELDIIADKLVESETVKYTSAEIQKTVISFGSNRNMLDAYLLSLTEKGLYKEAAYAAKVFDALNSIDFD